MTLGIVSDTHGWLHPGLAEAFDGVDGILHAGDIGGPEILDALGQIAPVTAVWGNIDGPPLRRSLPETAEIDAGGLRLRMTHIGGRPGRWERGILAALKADAPGVFICGHSHILRVARVPELGGMLFVNPGAAGRQGFHAEKTAVRLAIEGGEAVRADIIHLDR